MIWVLICGLCLVVFAYIAMPLYVKNPVPDDRANSQEDELIFYRNELRKIEKKLSSGNEDITGLTAQKTSLEKRLLLCAARTSSVSNVSKTGWMLGTFLFLITSSFGVYSLIGSPELANSKAQKPAILSVNQAISQNAPAIQHENNASMEELVSGLERKLQAGGDNPQQWGLYARSLMTLNRFDEAFLAYEKTLYLTDNNPEIVAELESARAFAAQQSVRSSAQPGPTRADVEASAKMGAEDRAAMIQGMVDGLALKLAENPDDPARWVRLLRARKVLGQIGLAQQEIETLTIHFKNQPEIVTQILQQSGWQNQ